MKTEHKINRKFLIYLLFLGVQKQKIADLLFVSRKSLFTYLQNFPISETEFQNMDFDRESLELIAMNCFDENSENTPIQKSFRLPENNIQKQKASQVNKVTQKSSSIKPVKKDDELNERKNHFDELEEYQNRLKENIVDG